MDNTNFTDLPRIPWGYLNKLIHELQTLKPSLSAYQQNVSLGKDLMDKFTFYLDLETQADILFGKVKEFVKNNRAVSTDALFLFEEAKKLFEELNKIWRLIKDLTSGFHVHGLDHNSNIPVERALREVEQILQEIKSRNFQPSNDSSQRELRKAQAQLKNVNKLMLDRNHVDDIKRGVNVLGPLLDDLIKTINEGIRKSIGRSSEAQKICKFYQKEVQGAVAVVIGHTDSANLTLEDASRILLLANSGLIDAAVKFEYFPRLLRDLENIADKLDEKRNLLSYLNSMYKNKYVKPAELHADILLKQSYHLTNLFSATRKLSEFPLQAAKAYQGIVGAIVSANTAAHEAEEAANNAYQQAYPEGTLALTEQAEKTRRKSLELLVDAQKLNDEKVPELEEIVFFRKQKLGDLTEDLAFAKRKNDLIEKELHVREQAGNHKEMTSIIVKAAMKSSKANEKATQLLHRLEFDLQPKFDSARLGTVRGLENLTRIIQQAKEDTRSGSKLAYNSGASADRVVKQHQLTKLNLKEVKEKILLARQKASSIRVGLTTDSSGRCFRSYKPSFEPSTTNNIVLNYATKSNSSDSLLLFIGSVNEDDFLAIEMVNFKIRFLWNVGGGTKVITHNLTIERNNEQLLKSDQWYKIEANRIGNLGTLSVKKTPDGKKHDPFEVSGASPAGYTKMDLDVSSELFIGGFPEDYLPPSELHTSLFTGCLYEALFDGKPVGLWNFMHSKGCYGCKEGATEDIDITAFEFQGGSSYAIIPQIPYYKKSSLYIVLSFKSLNEDSLLFLSCNSETGEYISIELKQGKLVFQLLFGEKSFVYLKTEQKYNTGRWIRVEVSRERFEAQVLVEDEYLKGHADKGSSSSLNLKESILYYGGVPPNFTKERWPKLTFKHFFGCLKDLQIDSTPIDLSRGSSYGMTVGCSERPVKLASFQEAGYLAFASKALLSDISITFSFLSYQKNALLMLLNCKEQGKKSAESFHNYFSLSLSEGHVLVRLPDGSSEVLLSSDNTFNTGLFHTINIIRKNRRMLLRVDDEDEAEIRLPKGAKDFLNMKDCRVFIGGIKQETSVSNISNDLHSLIGVIKDVIINDRLLRFETAVEHKGVDFESSAVQNILHEKLPEDYHG